jgi:hypothetical protein
MEVIMSFGSFAKKSLMLSFAVAAFVAWDAREARADGYFECLPDAVAHLSNRVHVHCSNSWAAGGDTVTYIAIDKTDAEKVAHFISMGTTALLAKKKFNVFLPTSSSTNVNGCDANNCRTPTYFSVKE